MNRSNHRKCSTKISFSKPLIYITFSYASLSLALTNVPVFWLWSDTSLSLSLHFVKTCLRRPFLKIDLLSWRSSLTEVFCKKGALKKFKKRKGKHLYQSLPFLNKLQISNWRFSNWCKNQQLVAYTNFENLQNNSYRYL